MHRPPEAIPAAFFAALRGKKNGAEAPFFYVGM